MGDPTCIGIFSVYLRMALIFTDFQNLGMSNIFCKVRSEVQRRVVLVGTLESPSETISLLTYFIYLFRILWAVLLVLAAASCVRFCIETFRVYFSYPTKTVISTSSAGIKSPDITICNHNGFDAAVLKSLTQYLYAAENKTANDDWQYASEILKSLLLICTTNMNCF